MAHLNAAPADMNTPAEQAPDHVLRVLIAEQNDAFRQVLGFAALWRGQHLKGRAVVTPGFLALPERTQAALMEAVISFTDWTEDNDPYEDHSFGRVEAHGVAIFWKIDLYDTAYTYGAETPSDPEQTCRVLTLYCRPNTDPAIGLLWLRQQAEPSRTVSLKGGELMSRETLQRRLAEAWALVRKGDTFGIGRRFLIQHGAL